jgi:RNA polymerase sigma-70 factor, ECF subfamily
MTPITQADRDYLHLLARCLWQPGLQRRLDLSDVVQGALLKAHRHGEQFRGRTEAERRGWLRAILRQELFAQVRGNPVAECSLDQSSRRWDEALAGADTSPSDGAVREETFRRLARALGGLAEDERTAVELRHLHGCSVGFIGQHLGRTRDATAGLLKRGLHKLRLLLQEEP